MIGVKYYKFIGYKLRFIWLNSHQDKGFLILHGLGVIGVGDVKDNRDKFL
jgi:hypothetical protein